MSSKEYSPLGQAWRSHAVGRNDAAVDAFLKIADDSPEDMDVLYGLALSQKGAGQHEAALVNFRRVLELIRASDVAGNNEDDRIAMLTRMVQQQIAFLEGAKK